MESKIEQSNISLVKKQTSELKGEEKEIYFILLLPDEERVNTSDITFASEIPPKIIYEKKIEKENGSFIEHIVFKLNIKKKENEKKKSFLFQFIIGYYEYDISFSVRENTFIYYIELQKANKYLKDIIKENIDQNIIPLEYKLDIFLEALENYKEDDKKDKLYEDTINLYEKKKKL